MTEAMLSQTEWCFHKIESAEPERAAILKAAGSPNTLIQALRSALAQGFEGDGIRFGHEQNSSQPDDWRSVLQFRVGTCLFDWFFNARTGYRAHFKKSPETGLRFNEAIVKMIIDTINSRASQTLDVILLDINYQNIGASQILREQFLLSFALKLSKIWLCALLIEPGQIKQLPFGATGPKIRVSPPDDCWLAFYQELDAEAWLQVEGAFCGSTGLYQPMNPLCRAKTLHRRGAV
jgi:hypothetical protein